MVHHESTPRGAAQLSRFPAIRFCLAVCLAMLQTGCTNPTYMVASPNLYVNSAEDPYASVPPELRTTDVKVLYATDRQRQEMEDGGWVYGTNRSRTIAIGLATVSMGEGLSWPDLVDASRTAKRKDHVPLDVTQIDERLQYPALPPAIEVDGRWVDPPEYVEEVNRATQEIHQLLSQQLALTPRKEVYLFVHGYNNTFKSGCFRSAQLWHFLGRGGVPALFSWPAGSTGLLRGYTRDRESGEFANTHLKTFLRRIASCPDVQKIHLIAHSRGTDILSTAVRELHLEYRAAGQDTRSALKLGQIILAAPDIDLDVFVEKFSADRVGFVAERLTIYVSANDKAIGLANWLFSSARRIGQLAMGDLGHELAASVEKHPILSIVDVRAKTDKRGHGYFLSSPAVLSDVILVLRDHRKPGAENGRPLLDRPGGFWELYNEYPAPLSGD